MPIPVFCASTTSAMGSTSHHEGTKGTKCKPRQSAPDYPLPSPSCPSCLRGEKSAGRGSWYFTDRSCDEGASRTWARQSRTWSTGCTERTGHGKKQLRSGDDHPSLGHASAREPASAHGLHPPLRHRRAGYGPVHRCFTHDRSLPWSASPPSPPVSPASSSPWP